MYLFAFCSVTKAESTFVLTKFRTLNYPSQGTVANYNFLTPNLHLFGIVPDVVEAESLCRSCTKWQLICCRYIVQFAQIIGEDKIIEDCAFDKPFHQKKAKP
jgi:hypothetical protein